MNTSAAFGASSAHLAAVSLALPQSLCSSRFQLHLFDNKTRNTRKKCALLITAFYSCCGDNIQPLLAISRRKYYDLAQRNERAREGLTSAPDHASPDKSR
jgi:hypothetical protein